MAKERTVVLGRLERIEPGGANIGTGKKSDTC